MPLTQPRSCALWSSEMRKRMFGRGEEEGGGAWADAAKAEPKVADRNCLRCMPTLYQQTPGGLVKLADGAGLEHGSAGEKDLFQFELGVEEKQVCPFAGGDAAAMLGDAGAFGGRQRGHADDGGKHGDVALPEAQGAGHLADHMVHALDRTGQALAGDEADATITGEPTAGGLGAEAVLPGRKIDGAVGIGDEAEAIWPEELEGEAKQFFGEVAAVGDDFGAHFGGGEDELFHAGLHGSAVFGAERGNRTHGAPEVVNVADAGGEGPLHF